MFVKTVTANPDRIIETAALFVNGPGVFAVAAGSVIVYGKPGKYERVTKGRFRKTEDDRE
jgi:hypothetical protein